MTNFQREGSVSNAHVGRDFEALARKTLAQHEIIVEPEFAVPVGISSLKKPHKFDLGSNSPKVIVECKSHKWTKGNNVPSAKMTVWNEAMYYFSISSSEYRKIFFILKDKRLSTKETLAQYYLRTYSHLIPSDVEFWEYDQNEQAVLIHKRVECESQAIAK